VSLLISKGASIDSRTKVSYLYSHLCIIVDDKVYSDDDFDDYATSNDDDNVDSHDDDNVDSHDDDNDDSHDDDNDDSHDDDNVDSHDDDYSVELLERKDQSSLCLQTWLPGHRDHFDRKWC
jgi:hypothetical protein